MSQSNFKTQNWQNLITIFRTYPVAFFEQLNFKNINTFWKALRNEPPEQIMSNVKKLLSRKTSSSEKTLNYSISKFANEFETINDKKLVICISHEASRTGAPAIIKNIGKHFKEQLDLECIYILCKGGVIRNEFESIAPTYELKFFENDELLAEEMQQLIAAIKTKFDVQGVFFNSEASTKLLDSFEKENLGPRISLIHETGSYFEKNAWNHISPASDQVIFPCEAIKKLALVNSAFQYDKLQVLPQGLMKPELLDLNRSQTHAALAKELGISNNAYIVLSCGSTDARKGIDIFTFTAIHTIRNTTNDIHFVWLGDSTLNEHKIWTERDIAQVQLENRIHFLGSKDDVSKYFAGSDLFFMSSRGDPFPCVVQEALASGLSVVGFENTGGTPEMVPDGCGKILPYADFHNASKIILEYSNSSKAQREMNSKNCRNHALVELDFQKYVDQLSEHLKDEVAA